MKHLRVAAIAAAAMLGLSAAPAQAEPPPPVSSFTVITGFSGPTSDITEADGVWEGCTAVTDLSGAENQISPTKVQFSGEKLVHCPDGDVVIHYDAVLSFVAADHRGWGTTRGTWSVVSSENDGIEGGVGTVTGNSKGCTDCIVDTFSGRIY